MNVVLGTVAYQRGDLGQAAARHEEALAVYRALSHRHGTARGLLGLGTVLHAQGDLTRAAARLGEALLLSHEVGSRWLAAGRLEGLAWVAVAHGQSQRAARLGGAAEALREGIGVPMPPEQRAGHDRAVQAMRAALGADRFAVAWAEGRALPLEDAVSSAGHAEAEERTRALPRPRAIRRMS